jgi:hypothetical protein
MSDYTVVDETIGAWVERNNLSLFTQYKDSEVRSVDVVGANGRRFQIWIDRPQGNIVSVHVWDYKKMRKDWEVDISELDTSLEVAISTAQVWGRK